MSEDYTADEELNKVLNRNREEIADEDWRLLQFHALVPDAPGQVGSLLRMIAHVHDEFAKSKAHFGTTHGEENRMYSILDEAMSTLEWLRTGEQS